MRWYVDAQPTVAMDDAASTPRTRRSTTTTPMRESRACPHHRRRHDLDQLDHGRAARRLRRRRGEEGRLRTKYIAPIHEDQEVISIARVTGITRNGEGETVYTSMSGARTATARS
jgi:hypothetical protein